MNTEAKGLNTIKILNGTTKFKVKMILILETYDGFKKMNIRFGKCSINEALNIVTPNTALCLGLSLGSSIQSIHIRDLNLTQSQLTGNTTF